MAISVGSVSVDVVPDLGRFVPELRGKMRDLPTVDLPVHAVTEAATAEIDRVAKAPRTATVDVAVGSTKAATAEIDKLVEKPRTANVTVRVDDTKAKKDVDALQKQIRDRTLQLNVSTGDARARLAQLTNEIAKTKAALKVNADDTEARSKLAALKKESTDLKGQLDLDTAPAKAEIADLQAALNRAKVTLQAEVDTTKAAAELARVTERDRKAQIKAEADTAKAEAQLAKLTGKRDINLRVDDQGSILSTTNRLGALLTAGIALGPAIVPAAAAAAAAIGAMGIGAAAAGAGIGTMVLAFSGVGDAVKAMSAAQQSAGADAAKSATAQVAAAEQVRSAEASLANVRANAADSARNSARAVADAQREVGVATREAARDIADALEAQASAQRGVRDASRDAARAVQTALFSQEQAEQSLASAQLAARQAQVSLTQAREDARQSIEDLTLQVEGGALAQRRAVLGVQEAQDALNTTMADPKATQRQRDLAQLAFDEAAQNLEEIGVRNQRLARDKAAADKAGINGSRQVQAATEGIATAEQRVQDARTQAARAADAVTEAQRAGSERIADARARVADAEQAVADARVAGAQRVQDAEARVAQATAAQAAQQRQSAFAIAQAQAAVATAHRQAAEAANASSTAQTKVATAMAALSPAGQRFAQFLFSLRSNFEALKATAQGGLLPGVQSGIQSLLPLFPTLNTTVGNAAKAMGDLFAQAGKALTSPFWREFFTMIQNTVGPNLTTFGQIIGNLATGFAGLLMAFQPVSEQLGGGLLSLSKRFAEFGAGASKNAGFQAFLNYIQNVGPIVIGTIRSIAKTIGRIIVALAPIGPVVLQSIGFLADVINRIPTDVLRVVLITIGALVIGFRVWAAAVWLLNVAMNANPISLIVIGLAALGAGLYLAYTRSETFRNIVDKAWAVVKAGAIAMWGVLRPILVAIGDFIMTKVVPAILWLWRNAIVPAFNGIRTAISFAWNNIILPIFRAIRWYINNVVGPVFTWLWRNVISPAFTGIRIAIGVAWKLVEVILKAWVLFFKAVLGPAFSWLWDKAIKPAMSAIGTGISVAWNRVIKPVFEVLRDFIKDHIAPAFTAGVTAIGKAWDKVKDIAKVPIKFVVNTVLNDGIIAAFNKINDAVGKPVKPIARFQLPAGFARGTEDHRAQIAHPNQPRLWAEPETGGEAYIPLAPSKRARSARILDDVARRFGYGLIKMANGGTLLTAGRHLRDLGYNVAEGPGEFGPVHRVHAPNSRHYDGMALDINHGAGTSKAEQAALSRIVPYLQGLGLRVLFMVPNHYNHLHTDVPRGKGALSQIGGMVKGAAGAVADFLDPSKLITGPLQGLLNRIPGRDSVLGKIVAGVPKVLAKALVDKATGFVGAIAGTTGDLKDTPGTGGFGGSARWAQTVMVVLRQLGQPTSAVGAVLRRIQFESGGNPHAINKWDVNARRGTPSMGLMQTIAPTFNAYAGPYMARGVYDPLANIYAGVNYALQRYGSLAAIDPKNRPRGYDAGGYLQPGLTTVYNGTGKPEPVFTAEQFAAMRANGGSRGGLTINGDVHTASVEEFMREAAMRQRLDAALHPIFA